MDSPISPPGYHYPQQPAQESESPSIFTVNTLQELAEMDPLQTLTSSAGLITYHLAKDASKEQQQQQQQAQAQFNSNKDTVKNEFNAAKRRRNSWAADSTDSASLAGRDSFAETATELVRPGAFRRDYIRRMFEKKNPTETFNPAEHHEGQAWTHSFMTFLDVYGEQFKIALDSPPTDEDDAGIYTDEEDVGSTYRRGSWIAKSDMEKEEGLDTTAKKEQLNSNSKTFFMLLKAFIGTGMLMVPRAFKDGGMVLSIGVVIIMASLSLAGMLALVAVKSHLNGQAVTFPGIAKHIAYRLQCNSWLVKLSGSNPKLAKASQIFVEIGLVSSQFGFSASFISFVANAVQSVLKEAFHIDVELHLLIFPQLLFYLPLCLLRRLTKLSPLAIIADVFVLFGITTVIFFDGLTLSRTGRAPISLINTVDYPYLLGTVVFAFEGIGLVLPIQNAMHNPKAFPRLLTIVVIITGLCMILLSATSYLAFGDEIKAVVFSSITDSVTRTGTRPEGYVIHVATLGYALAVLFTFPLMIFPGTRIVESHMSRWDGSGKDRKRIKWSKNAIRSGCVALVALLAWGTGHRLENLVALVGALCCGPLLFIFPGLLHATIARNRWIMCADLFLALFGILATVFCTVYTFMTWTSH